ncbi:hypothetical protein ATCC90586_001327 [Pythium insidiosum]|nr:hypothetical protein ATCC90586_001327 [Pythium insidiosum]
MVPAAEEEAVDRRPVGPHVDAAPSGGLAPRGHVDETSNVDDDEHRSSDDEDDAECRVCRGEAEPDRRLVAPCRCSGSIRFTHSDCLEQWLEHSGKTFCELCGYTFVFTPLYDANAPDVLPWSELLSTVLRLIAARWIPFALRLVLVAVLWLGVAPWCTSWLYRMWLLRAAAMGNINVSDRFSRAPVVADVLAGLVLIIVIIFSFLALMSFADFLRFHQMDDVVEENAPPVGPVAAPVRQRQANGIGAPRAPVPEPRERPGEEMAAEELLFPGVLERHDLGLPLQQQVEGENDGGDDARQPAQELRQRRPLREPPVMEADAPVDDEDQPVPIARDAPPAGPPLQNNNNGHRNAPPPMNNNNNNNRDAWDDDFEHMEINIAMEDLVGLRGDIVVLFRNVSWLLAFNGLGIDFFSLRLFNVTAQERVVFCMHNMVGAILVHWVLGITFMLFVTVSVLQLREVMHPDILANVIRPQEAHPDLLRSLLSENSMKHARRMVASLVIYTGLLLMLVHVPIRVAQALAPQLFPVTLRFQHYSPEVQVPIELLIVHFSVLAILEHSKNEIGRLQHIGLVNACRAVDPIDDFEDDLMGEDDELAMGMVFDMDDHDHDHDHEFDDDDEEDEDGVERENDGDAADGDAAAVAVDGFIGAMRKSYKELMFNVHVHDNDGVRLGTHNIRGQCFDVNFFIDEVLLVAQPPSTTDAGPIMRRVLETCAAFKLPSGLQPERVRWLYDGLATASPTSSASNRYLLYWMQTSVRSKYNYSLEYAIAAANALELPLHVVYMLSDRSVVDGTYRPRDLNAFGFATERHAKFAIEGLTCVQKRLASRGLSVQVLHHRHEHGPERAATPFWSDLDQEDDDQLSRPAPQDPETAPSRSDLLDICARNAALVITDRPYLRPWRDALAECVDAAKSRQRTWGLVQVESDVVVPCETASPKEEYAARTIRPKIHAQLKRFLVELTPQDVAEVVQTRDRPLELEDASIEVLDLSRPDDVLARLDLDRSVPGVTGFRGGEDVAVELAKSFLETKLGRYATDRNEPSGDGGSNLSLYLRFGHISPVRLALNAGKVKNAKEGKDSFLEELIVRRELAVNMCVYNDQYDTMGCLPEYATITLQVHAKDKREHLYTVEQLEAGKTYDVYWNAAQLEMVYTGKMHGYMRIPEEYFRLLKKTNMLDQLLELGAQMEAQDQELARLQAERTKHETVQERIYRELELYKGRFLEAQKALLEVVEGMTKVCITEEQLQQGSTSKDAVTRAGELAEERVMTDLQQLAKCPDAVTG